GLSIGVARGGEVILAQGYGMADREAGVAAGPDTSYPVASVSKHFTAAALLRLADQGRLRLDDPLGTLIEGARPPVAQLPLRTLLNHTSGLAVRGGPSPRARALRALRAGVTAAPGNEFSYSNTGFALLGLVIERVTGLRYADAMREVTTAAALTSTGYCEAGAPVPNRTRDYGVGAGGLAPSTYWQHEKFFAAGGLCSSVNDLLRFVRALEEGRVVSPASLQVMRAAAMLPGGVEIGYGLGTRMGETAGRRKLGHTGGGTSNKAVLARYPQDDVTIAVLLNTEAYEARVTAMELEAAVARLLFGAPEAPVPASVPVEQLRRYAGTYDETGRVTRVTVDAEGHRLAAGGFGPLLPEGGDAFVDADDPGVSLRFVTRDAVVIGYMRRHEGWFVDFGRRIGDAEMVVEKPKASRPARRGRRHRRGD
ncbi:MAG TPA: serine hydrolase domain-containing protein, partial [Vicinamibacteria bacterium]|nr:serine hydrolase domain-containing protein [Vicinamibacteria bacterium]